jgi:peptidoglycan hydrolase-like protein with peptidoglycan-binding domain
MNKYTTKTLLLTAVTATVLTAQAYAYTPITSQLDPGARGYNVTNLQTFFADNASIYPEGLVTGYFGSMTKSAVQRFQANYGFDQVGRVGPMTLNKINSLIATGGWTNTPVGDVSAPMIYSVSNTVSSNSASFSWTTNENATARVFFNTMPLVINEGDETSAGFALRAGQVAANDNIARSSQQVTLNGLTSNTLYYYMIVSTDTNGNVSVSNVNGTFRTN